METTLLAQYPSCGASPCIDSIFGPPAAGRYWSSTRDGPAGVWYVDFSNGNLNDAFEFDDSLYRRAVR